MEVGNISKTVGVRMGAAGSAAGEGSAVRPQPTTETISTSIQIRESFFINDTPYQKYDCALPQKAGTKLPLVFFQCFSEVGAGVGVEVDFGAGVGGEIASALAGRISMHDGCGRAGLLGGGRDGC